MLNSPYGPPAPKPEIRFSVTVDGQNIGIRFDVNDGRWFLVGLDADHASRLGAAILEAAGQIEPAIDWPEQIGD